MKNIKRKCVSLHKDHVEYINQLVRNKKAKNFSRALNEMIDEVRERRKNENISNR